MLGQHPALYACAELECFTGDTLADCLAYAERVPVITMHGLLRTLAQLLCGEQSDRSVMAARQWVEAREHWSGAQLVTWLETRIAPLRLIEKSPIHVLRWTAMQRLAAVGVNQPAVHLSRHPLSAVRSLMTAYSHRGQPLNPSQALRSWVQGHRQCLRYSAELAQAPTLLLHCEDLLRAPEAALQRVCAHLRLDSTPASLAAMLHPERSPYACLGPKLAPTGNDPNWMQSPVLRCSVNADPPPALMQLWDLDDVPAELVMVALQLGWELGYS